MGGAGVLAGQQHVEVGDPAQRRIAVLALAEGEALADGEAQPGGGELGEDPAELVGQALVAGPVGEVGAGEHPRVREAGLFAGLAVQAVPVDVAADERQQLVPGGGLEERAPVQLGAAREVADPGDVVGAETQPGQPQQQPGVDRQVLGGQFAGVGLVCHVTPLRGTCRPA